MKPLFGRLGRSAGRAATVMFLGLLMLLTYPPMAGLAAPVLDQACDPDPLGVTFSPVYQVYELAQTWRVGLSGHLVAVELKLRKIFSPTQNLLFDIRQTTAGAPTEPDSGPNLLFAAVISPDQVSGADFSWVSINLGAGALPVSAGTDLAMVLRSEPSGGFYPYEYFWGGSLGDLYPLGIIYLRIPGEGYPTWSSFLETEIEAWNHDFAFKTWVAPVPLPPTLLLLASGLGGLWCLRKRRGGA